MAGSSAAREAVWLRALIIDLDGGVLPVTKRCDSDSAIAMMRNTTSSSRTKHVDVAYRYVRERVVDKTLTIVHVGTKQMLAVGLTKALPVAAFEACRSGMGLTANHLRMTAAGECCE